jgi:hypothetical protein
MSENDLPLDHQEKPLSPSNSGGGGYSFGNQTPSQLSRDKPLSALKNMMNACNLGTKGRMFPFQATTTTQVAIAANPFRVGFAVQNNGSEAIWFSFGRSISVQGSEVLGGIKIEPTGYYELIGTYCPQDEISVRCLTSSAMLTMLEVTK